MCLSGLTFTGWSKSIQCFRVKTCPTGISLLRCMYVVQTCPAVFTEKLVYTAVARTEFHTNVVNIEVSHKSPPESIRCYKSPTNMLLSTLIQILYTN